MFFYSRNAENLPLAKDANPHFQHVPNHQHSLSPFHFHGSKGFQNIQAVKQFPISNIPSTHVIQNQQTIIHKTNPSFDFSGTFPVPNQFGFHSPNTEITVNQNQAFNNNLRKSAGFEKEIIPEAFEPVLDHQIVS